MIHFAHGNGFPAMCYRKLLTELAVEHEVQSINMIGHNPKYPITENWTYLVEEVIDSIEKNSPDPVIGLGHSLGGVLTLLASFKRPELFSKIVLLDAPMFGFRKSTLIKLIKQVGLINKVTPSDRIIRRQYVWPSRDAVKSYLMKKKLYLKFDSDCLDDYIDYCMKKNDSNQYTLLFDRVKEGQIFKTVPHNMPTCFVQQNIPTILIYGTMSDIITKLDLRKMVKKYKFEVIPCEGTHMFPLEHPIQAASLINQILN